MKTYRTTKDIIIPAGTELSAPPKHSTRWANDYDAPVALGPNHCGYFSVDIAEGIEAGWIDVREKNDGGR
jgi:hypothetical protein